MKVLRKLTFWCLLIILAGEASCQKNVLKTSPLNGTWIECITKNDTIVFAAEYDGQNPVFELKRGFRITEEGYKLPDYYSGPYSYKLSGDSISLYWFLSSGSFNSYFFEKMTGENKFLIGNFFKNPENSGNESDTLVFERIQ
jgi:hypothetical protein